jgi:hypothetical protein
MQPFQMFAVDGGTCRYRVDTACGYTSYGAKDKDKALEAFANGGIRLRLCRDIFDDGVVIAGLPIEEKKMDWRATMGKGLRSGMQ